MKHLYLKSILGLFLLHSCSILKTGSSDSKTLFTVDEKAVKTEEFVYVFNKNRKLRNKLNDSKDEVKTYLDSYINFKLKVKEARDLGLAQDKQYIKELSSYKEQLAEPFLINNKNKEKIAKEIFQHTKHEVKASHILVKVDKSDTTKAYNKILELRNRVIAGEPFHDLAFQHSEDPSAKINKGDLGYFSAMRMVYPFEEHAFSTAVGNVSSIFSTQFGYHILKVNDKRPVLKDVKIAHIFLESNLYSSDSEKALGHEKIHRIHDYLSQGDSWEELCESFSEDKMNRYKSGEIKNFSSRNDMHELRTPVYSLEKVGDFSEPVKSQNGWHILKLLANTENKATYEDMKPQLLRYASNALRSDLAKKDIMKHLSSNLKLEENQKTRSNLEVLANQDSIPLENKKLFRLADSTYLTKDFIAEYKAKRSTENIDAFYKEFLYDELLNNEEEYLLEHNKEYAMLLNEYTEGLLLFSVMEKKIWNKVTEDSLGLKRYFENNKEKYQEPRTAKLFLFSSQDKATLEEIESDLAKMTTEEQQDKSVVEKYLKRYLTASVAFEEIKYAEGDRRFSSNIPFAIGNFDFQKNARNYYAQVKKIEEIKPVSFQSAKGAVIVDFQNYLEKEWIKDLHTKYKVIVNTKELEKLKKHFEL